MERSLLWAARVRPDSLLLGFWWGQHLLAVLGLAIGCDWLTQQLGLSCWWTLTVLLPAVWLFRSARHLPDAIAGTGRLTLRSEGVSWEKEDHSAQSGGCYRWLWCSQWLVGIEWRDGSGDRHALWLTPGRTGADAWRRLQTFRRLQGCRNGDCFSR